jgi:tetratricopeptide (TPR) repeat protein
MMKLLVLVLFLVQSVIPLATLRRQAAEAREQNRADDAIRLYRNCLKLQPNWPEGWWYLGTLHYDQNSFGPARDALTRLTQLEPKAPGAAWALLGLSEFETKDYAESLKHLQRSWVQEARGDPFGRATRYHAALLYTRSGQFELALKQLSQIVEPNQDTPEMLRAIGTAALRMPILAADLPASEQEVADSAGRAVFEGFVRHEKEAEAMYQEILARYPNRAELHYLHGVALLTSDPQAAIAELSREIEISPRHIPARLQIAFEYLKQGEPAKALPFARESVSIDPKSFAAHAAMAQALADSADLNGAIAEYEKASNLAPDSAEIHRKLGSAYAQAGRDKEAAREREIFAKLTQRR